MPEQEKNALQAMALCSKVYYKQVENLKKQNAEMSRALQQHEDMYRRMSEQNQRMSDKIAEYTEKFADFEATLRLHELKLSSVINIQQQTLGQLVALNVLPEARQVGLVTAFPIPDRVDLPDLIEPLFADTEGEHTPEAFYAIATRPVDV